MESFVSRHLKPLHNLAVFHASDDHLIGQLEEVGNDPIVFESHVGVTIGNSWYELADVSAMKAGVGHFRGTAEFQQAVERLTNDVFDHLDKFEPACDMLVALTLRSEGFRSAPPIPGKGFWPE